MPKQMSDEEAKAAVRAAEAAVVAEAKAEAEREAREAKAKAEAEAKAAEEDKGSPKDGDGKGPDPKEMRERRHCPALDCCSLAFSSRVLLCPAALKGNLPLKTRICKARESVSCQASN